MSNGTHKCSAPGCDRALPISKFMCPNHWSRLPQTARDEVNEAWRAWSAAPSVPAAFALREAQQRAIGALPA